MNMNISAYIPATWRKPIYGAFAVAGVLIGAFQVGIAAVGAENPDWLLVVLAVFPFLAGAVGFTASSNTDTTINDDGWDKRIDGNMADYATADDTVELED